MRALLFAGLAVGLSVSASAQSATWFPIPSDRDAISLTARHILFDGDRFPDGTGYSALSSTWFLGTRTSLSSRVRVVTDLPFVTASLETSASQFDVSESTLGNPFIGLEVSVPSEQIQSTLGFGGRVPLVGTVFDLEEFVALQYGLNSDYNRLGSFPSDVTTLVGTARARYAPTPDLAVTGGLTPQLLIPISSQASLDDPELFGGYFFRAEISTGPALLSAGVSGIGILTEDIGRGASRFEHELGVAAEFESGPVRPGAFVILPIGGDRPEVINAIVGLGASFSFD